MIHSKRFFVLVLWMGLLTLVPLGMTLAQDADEQATIDFVSTHPEFADYLATYPDWTHYAEVYDGNFWYVEFYSEQEDEWLGYAVVNMDTMEFTEFFVPKPLPPGEFAVMQPRVQEFVLNDGEVQALLDNPNFWDIWVDYNRWEQYWEVSFYRGIEAWVVALYIEGDEIYIDQIFDPNVLEEDDLLNSQRYEAIALAYEADGIDIALANHDNWTTYVSPQGENRWAVDFVVNGQMVFHALVNIDSWTVLQVITS